MMRLRSSSRCCSRLIEPSCRPSFSSSWGISGSATRLGIVIPRNGILHAIGQTVERALNGKVLVAGNLGDLRLKVLARISLLQFQLADFLMDLALKLTACPPEFGHKLANRTGDLRQLPGPKQDEGQQ